MEAKTKKDLYSKIEKNLNLILSNEEIYKNLDDKKFMNSFALLLENFKILEETIKPAKPLIKTYIKKLESLNKKINFSKNKLDLENDIIDNINFIKTFVKNITNKNIEEFDNNIELNSNQVLDLNKNENINNENKNDFEYNYGNYEDYKKTILNQMVQKRLSEDQIKGNYYFYDSKPKIIPILRYFVGIMIIFASIIFLAKFIVSAICVIFISENGVPKEVRLMSVNPFSTTLLIILVMAFIYLGYKHLIPIKNDNFKYNLSNFPLIFAIFMGVFMLGNDIWILVNTYSNGLLNQYIANGTTNSNIIMYQLVIWISLSLSIFLILFAIPLTINYIFKPKRNLKLTSELTEKYKREIYEKGIIK